jgi:hypothetical protein
MAIAWLTSRYNLSHEKKNFENNKLRLFKKFKIPGLKTSDEFSFKFCCPSSVVAEFFNFIRIKLNYDLKYFGMKLCCFIICCCFVHLKQDKRLILL